MTHVPEMPSDFHARESKGVPHQPQVPLPVPPSVAFQKPEQMIAFLQGPMNQWIIENQGTFTPGSLTSLQKQLDTMASSLQAAHASTEDVINAYQKVIGMMGEIVAPSSLARQVDQLTDHMNYAIQSSLGNVHEKMDVISGKVQSLLLKSVPSSDLADLASSVKGLRSQMGSLEASAQTLAQKAEGISSLSHQIVEGSSSDIQELGAQFSSFAASHAALQSNLANAIDLANQALEQVKSTHPAQAQSTGGDSSNIVNGVWYPTWRTPAGQVPPIPQGVNVVNLFVGELDPTQGVTGLQGAFADPSILKQFIQECNAQGIKVMVSVGGNGGSYDDTWNQLQSGNLDTYAQALDTFCKNYGVNGIDFDWEQNNPPAGMAELVGGLIKDFKDVSGLQTSLCTNAGTYWETQASEVFSAAEEPDGSSAIDHLNIMAYNSFSSEQGYIEGWESWAEQYHLSNAQITVGMLASASDLQQFAQWDESQGLSSGLWFWDAADPTASNNESSEVWNIYHSSESARNKIQQKENPGGASS